MPWLGRLAWAVLPSGNETMVSSCAVSPLVARLNLGLVTASETGMGETMP